MEKIMNPRSGHCFRFLRNARQAFALCALLFLFLTTNTQAGAQALYGSLTGSVTDTSGAVLPNVTVTVTDQGTGAVRSTQASALGVYAVRNLLPGVFTVSVAKQGNFAGFTEKNIVVNVNEERRVDVALRLASVTAEITVDEAPPMLQTETAEVDNEISENQLASLPVTSSQGRNFQALYTILPGAAAVGEQNSTASNPSRAMSVNMNGTEDMGVAMRIDGAMNQYGWLPYLVAYVPPSDAIANVNVVSNSFNAETGMAGGAAINVTIKSGTSKFHGGGWEYYQDAALNARPYTSNTGSIPKNIFHQFGFNLGGPVYIPHILTGKKKLFFFENFERTTRRQLITGLFTVPDSLMLSGDFSEATANTTLYDPQPGGVAATGANAVNGFLLPGSRPTFLSEYGCNCVPAARQSLAAQKMLALLSPIAKTIGTPTAAQIASNMSNDYSGSGTLAYNRNTSDTKINYIASDKTQIFGRYSIEPFTVNDPQALGAAGGGTFDGGQPGAAHGRIQNAGLGTSHVFSPNLVMDADAGYTRQVTGAQSMIDLADKDFGTDVLGIPGTNGSGPNYFGQPEFVFSTGFSGLGNTSGANPFLFRDNQFTADVNLSYTHSKHATKFGFTFFHFDLNHFQPTSGGGVSSPRGGFQFQGGMTSAGTSGLTAYNSLADMLLGLPNNGTGIAVAKETQRTNPNAIRWSTFGLYAQDQWTVTPKLTVNYGVRYELYPSPYRDHGGVFILDPSLPQSGNVEIGGVAGNPTNAGLDMGHGFFGSRAGIAYRLDAKTVIRSGGGITTDPDSLRYLRDSFPEDISPTYVGTSVGTISVDPSNKTTLYPNGAPLTLMTGIPTAVFPDISTGFASLPVSGSTTTTPKHFHRGYIESWNLFVQRDLGKSFVGNIGYVGTHQVRQLAGVGYLNAAPLPSGDTLCMSNGQFNPASGLTGPCSFQANTIVNQSHCDTLSAADTTCYNTGGINMTMPLFSSNYNGLQTQLTRMGGKNSAFGIVYTFSHAFDYEDNGGGSGSAGTTFNYPTMYSLNRAHAGYDRTHNFQAWGNYHLPFGMGQAYLSHGLLGQIVGGFQLNGQFSHISGAPFSVSANANNMNTPGVGALYANLSGAYKELGGHVRTAGQTNVSSGKAWFDPSIFSNPVEPTMTVAGNPNLTSPVFGNTHRNQFRGPGQSVMNASIFREFLLYRETKFELRAEAFNLLNHALPNNPNTTVPTTANSAAGKYGTFGMISSFGNTRSLQFGGRFTF